MVDGVQNFPAYFRYEFFSETELPVYGVLGNPYSLGPIEPARTQRTGTLGTTSCRQRPFPETRGAVHRFAAQSLSATTVRA